MPIYHHHTDEPRDGVRGIAEKGELVADITVSARLCAKRRWRTSGWFFGRKSNTDVGRQLDMISATLTTGSGNPTVCSYRPTSIRAFLFLPYFVGLEQKRLSFPTGSESRIGFEFGPKRAWKASLTRCSDQLVLKALTRRHPPAAGLILEIDIGEEQPLASKMGGVAEATEAGTAIANGAGL